VRSQTAAVVLSARGHRDMIPVWIALVVGLHLFLVAALIGFGSIHLIGALVTIVSLMAVPVAMPRSLLVRAVIGAGAGGVLLAGAPAGLVVAL
jgi:hypothetical protein